MFPVTVTDAVNAANPTPARANAANAVASPIHNFFAILDSFPRLIASVVPRILPN
jgi:hypothetical protein